MDRTHSIMRIATTASPVSGADVRDRMVELHLRFKIQKAVNLVVRHWKQWRKSSSSSMSTVNEVGEETTPPDKEALRQQSWPRMLCQSRRAST